MCYRSINTNKAYKCNCEYKNQAIGTSLVVQWVRLCAPNEGGLGSIPGRGTRSHMPQLRVCMM